MTTRRDPHPMAATGSRFAPSPHTAHARMSVVLPAIGAVAAGSLLASVPLTVLAPILTVLGAGAVATIVVVLADRWLARRGPDAPREPRSGAPPALVTQPHAGAGAVPAIPSLYFRSLPFEQEVP